MAHPFGSGLPRALDPKALELWRDLDHLRHCRLSRSVHQDLPGVWFEFGNDAQRRLTRARASIDQIDRGDREDVQDGVGSSLDQHYLVASLQIAIALRQCGQLAQ